MRTLDLECVKKVRDNQEIDVTPMGRNEHQGAISLTIMILQLFQHVGVFHNHFIINLFKYFVKNPS